MEPLHRTPFRPRPEPGPSRDPLSSAVRALRLGAVLGAAVIAFLLGAQSFFGWRPPIDPAWLVIPAFLAPAVIAGVRERHRRKRVEKDSL